MATAGARQPDRPAAPPTQWYWDSCFSAIVWRRLDRGRARPSSRACSPPSPPGFIVRAVLAAGLREYYDPITGRGMGAVDFAWSTLALELAHPDPAASRSYL